MPKFAANLTLLFTELPFLDRFAAAQRAGFEAVEFLFPYEHPAEEIAKALHDCGLPLALFNTPAGNWAAGERGRAALPETTPPFAEDLRLALAYADILRPNFIHVMAGIAQGDAAMASFCENLRHCCAQRPKQQFLIEPINPYDIPGYFLNDFTQAQKVLRDVAAPNLALQFDAYHAYRITGNLPHCWQQNRAQARHIQIAGHPGRHEPNVGEIDYPAFFKTLDSQGYDGFVSAEYHPQTTTEDGLGWR